eukprot:TRINITY_DN49776_c0_g1_i1.p1 TRINITY_DN49776_c0_g1~~TRINITY_DN49776_c0_g1_i1.p1  ORF type:complete len:760 (-),score=144.02 TRINITY_DN49776_c0_g1_i1:73-2352(-)
MAADSAFDQPLFGAGRRYTSNGVTETAVRNVDTSALARLDNEDWWEKLQRARRQAVEGFLGGLIDCRCDSSTLSILRCGGDQWPVVPVKCGPVHSILDCTSQGPPKQGTEQIVVAASEDCRQPPPPRKEAAVPLRAGDEEACSSGWEEAAVTEEEVPVTQFKKRLKPQKFDQVSQQAAVAEFLTSLHTEAPVTVCTGTKAVEEKEPPATKVLRRAAEAVWQLVDEFLDAVGAGQADFWGATSEPYEDGMVMSEKISVSQHSNSLLPRSSVEAAEVVKPPAAPAAGQLLSARSVHRRAGPRIHQGGAMASPTAKEHQAPFHLGGSVCHSDTSLPGPIHASKRSPAMHGSVNISPRLPGLPAQRMGEQDVPAASLHEPPDFDEEVPKDRQDGRQRAWKAGCHLSCMSPDRAAGWDPADADAEDSVTPLSPRGPKITSPAPPAASNQRDRTVSDASYRQRFSSRVSLELRAVPTTDSLWPSRPPAATPHFSSSPSRSSTDSLRPHCSRDVVPEAASRSMPESLRPQYTLATSVGGTASFAPRSSMDSLRPQRTGDSIASTARPAGLEGGRIPAALSHAPSGIGPQGVRAILLGGFEQGALNTVFVEREAGFRICERETYWSDKGEHFLFYNKGMDAWVVERSKRFKKCALQPTAGVAVSPKGLGGDLGVVQPSSAEGWSEWDKHAGAWQRRPGSGVVQRGRVKPSMTAQASGAPPPPPAATEALRSAPGRPPPVGSSQSAPPAPLSLGSDRLSAMRSDATPG